MKTYVVTLGGNVLEFDGKLKLLHPPSDWLMVTEDRESAYKSARTINTMKWEKMKNKKLNENRSDYL